MMRHYQKSFFLSNILYIILLAYDTAIFLINPNLSFIFFMIIHEYDNYYFAYAKPSNLSLKVKINLIVL